MTKTDEKLVIRWLCKNRECARESVHECAQEDLVLDSNPE